jgi:hypothetical protein
MLIRSKLKQICLVVGVISMVLLGFHWFGYESRSLQNTILALNALMFLLSIPCSVFVIPVVVSAYYFMAINPIGESGIYLNTIFLFVIGTMQWFWIAKFWSPTEPQFQTLRFTDPKLD